MADVASKEGENNWMKDGCLVSREYYEMMTGGMSSIISTFEVACSTPDFANHWSAHAGLESPSFHPNPHLTQGNPGYDKLQAALGKLPMTARLGAVFHGTATKNIEDILTNGLDPQRRAGQAYGPGEYFGKTPSISIGYCRGGLEMVIFVVVIPTRSGETTGPMSSRVYAATPPDFCVVNNNAHQLPLGTMKFKSVLPHVVQSSNVRKHKLMQLSKEVYAKGQALKETTTKAQIIQYLISEQVQKASEVYKKNRKMFKETSKKEISWYVHQKLDNDVIPAYFKKLPSPMTRQEIEAAKIASVEETAREERVAKNRLEDERKAVALAHTNPMAHLLMTTHQLGAMHAQASSAVAMAFPQARPPAFASMQQPVPAFSSSSIQVVDPAAAAAKRHNLAAAAAARAMRLTSSGIHTGTEIINLFDDDDDGDDGNTVGEPIAAKPSHGSTITNDTGTEVVNLFDVDVSDSSDDNGNNNDDDGSSSSKESLHLRRVAEKCTKQRKVAATSTDDDGGGGNDDADETEAAAEPNHNCSSSSVDNTRGDNETVNKVSFALPAVKAPPAEPARTKASINFCDENGMKVAPPFACAPAKTTGRGAVLTSSQQDNQQLEATSSGTEIESTDGPSNKEKPSKRRPDERPDAIRESSSQIDNLKNKRRKMDAYREVLQFLMKGDIQAASGIYIRNRSLWKTDNLINTTLSKYAHRAVDKQSKVDTWFPGLPPLQGNQNS